MEYCAENCSFLLLEGASMEFFSEWYRLSNEELPEDIGALRETGE